MTGLYKGHKSIYPHPLASWIVLRADGPSWNYVAKIAGHTASDALTSYANSTGAKVDGAYAVVPSHTWRKFKMRRTNVSIEEIQ